MSSVNVHKKGFVPEPPPGCEISRDRILLHCCCAPCSTAIIEWMVAQGLRPGIFFSNSNIVPFREYEIRRDELRRYAAAHGLETIDDEYVHSDWLAFVRHLESGRVKASEPVTSGQDAVAAPEEQSSPIRVADMPERGPRCLECFKFRLLRAARYASTHGYRLLTTTLASSRWKDLAQVDTAGRWACGIVNGLSSGNAFSLDSVTSATSFLSVDPSPESTEVLWWNQNWRRGGLQERRNALIKEWSMYNQTFCGCEFSERH